MSDKEKEGRLNDSGNKPPVIKGPRTYVQGLYCHQHVLSGLK